MAVRRLRLSERVHAHTEHDALERRITDLYTKAADQLGSDKAPVRLAALYALERLAQDNPDHRQTVVNLICAYLRMPYSASSDIPEDRVNTPRVPSRLTRDATAQHAKPHAVEVEFNVEDKAAHREEKQVRHVAQRILTDHLGAHAQGGIRVDLTGATLIDFNLTNATVGDASFYGAEFVHAAVFRGVTFTGNTNFACAKFSWPGAFFNGGRFSATSTLATHLSAPTKQIFLELPSVAMSDSEDWSSNPRASTSPKPR